MESMCGGIAVFDYDNDGWMDIFLVNGSTLEDLKAGKCHPSKLYRNNHDGTFTDVTAKSGLTTAAGDLASLSATMTMTATKIFINLSRRRRSLPQQSATAPLPM